MSTQTRVIVTGHVDPIEFSNVLEKLINNYNIAGFSTTLLPDGNLHYSAILVIKPVDPRMAMFNVTQWERDSE